MSDAIEKAVEVLSSGGLIGMPTETVYGLAGDARREDTVAHIYAQKGRPTFNPLIVHGVSTEALLPYVHMCDDAQRLADRFWPGPLTLVLPRRADAQLSHLVSAGLQTVAVRVPAHPVAQAILKQYDGPLAAPSANRSNMLSPTTAMMVHAAFPNLHVVDGGACDVGLESTIIGFDPHPVLYRLGGIAQCDIESVLGKRILPHNQDGRPHAPGMLKKHYAPHAPLRLNAMQPHVHELYLGFGDRYNAAQHAYPTFNLSPKGCTVEAASHLFSMLYQMDAWIQDRGAMNTHPMGIAVAPIPNTGLGPAIKDRLTRAAA